jgi:hypothetical protein
MSDANKPVFMTEIEVPLGVSGTPTDDIVVGFDRDDEGAASVWLNSYGGMMGEDGSILLEDLSDEDIRSTVNQIINGLQHALLRMDGHA